MLDVIMPVWCNDPETLTITEAAVTSLRQNDIKLILVDNGSTVGAGLLRQWADLYIRNKTNLGYAKAVNQGLKLAGDIVCVSNNDIRVSENWVTVSKEIMEKESVGSVHFRMIPYDAPMELGDHTYLTGRERWCTGSFFVMRNKWLFDENYLNSYDDWDIHYRMYQDKALTAYTTKACYQHFDSFTQKKVPWDREIQNDKNRNYFIDKHGDTPENLWTKMFPAQMKLNYYEVLKSL